MNEILEKLNGIFCDVFDNQSIIITEESTIKDIEEWDSLSHFEIVVAIEKQFSIKILSDEIRRIQTIKDFIDIIKLKKI